MASKSETVVDDSRAYEVGTITVNGRKYRSGGFSIDLDAGRMVAYVSQDPNRWRSLLTTWTGEPLAILRNTGTARGFNGVRLYCYRTLTPIAGFHWYGRGLGVGMMLRLRRGRKARA